MDRSHAPFLTWPLLIYHLKLIPCAVGTEPNAKTGSDHIPDYRFSLLEAAPAESSKETSNSLSFVSNTPSKLSQSLKAGCVVAVDHSRGRRIPWLFYSFQDIFPNEVMRRLLAVHERILLGSFDSRIESAPHTSESAQGLRRRLLGLKATIGRGRESSACWTGVLMQGRRMYARSSGGMLGPSVRYMAAAVPCPSFSVLQSSVLVGFRSSAQERCMYLVHIKSIVELRQVGGFRRRCCCSAEPLWVFFLQ